MLDQPLSYWLIAAKMGFEDDLCRLIEAAGLSRNEVAERVGCAPSRVMRILKGDHEDIQLDDMVKLARAVGGILQIRIIKENGEAVRVVDSQTAGELDDKRMAADEAASMRS